MSLATEIILCIVSGYLIGTFSTSYIIGKTNHLDIRDYGSGNAGTTNAFRVMGKKAGIITFIGDFLKAFIPLMIMKYVLLRGADECCLLMLIFGIMCVIGHNYPVWLHFKGGKGIAATGGVFVAFDPWILIPGAIIFGGVIYLSKYVSLGSICVSAQSFRHLFQGIASAVHRCRPGRLQPFPFPEQNTPPRVQLKPPLFRHLPLQSKARR